MGETEGCHVLVGDLSGLVKLPPTGCLVKHVLNMFRLRQGAMWTVFNLNWV